MCLKSVYIACIFLTISASFSQCTSRNISCATYPVYNDSSSEVTLNLLYAKATGDKDIVHYIWSSYKLPSVIVARTSIDSELRINIKKASTFEKGALEFSKKPFAVIGLTISELWEKFYDSDTDSISDASSTIGLGLEYFEWNMMNNDSFGCSEFSAFAKLSSANKNDESFSKKGKFNVLFSVDGSEETAKDSPHLIYTGNSTQVRVEFDDLYSNFSRTRYGLEMMMFSSQSHDCSHKECSVVSTDSISDEFSPGIFTDVDILPPCYQKDDERGSFLTWRPVAYTSQEISVANSSDAQLSSKCLHRSISNVASIAELYFLDQENISENIFNVTFGAEGDGFYPKTKFTSWSLMVGTGSAIHAKLSVAAIVFISVGLGALLLFFLMGGVFLTVRQCRKKDDDLLLSETSVN